jgi:hypothetical protein
MAFINKFLETYRPEEISFVFNGIDLTSGLDPNSHVVVRRNAKKYSYVPSIDGGGVGARLLNADTSATITVKIWSTSVVHKLLYNEYRDDDGTNPNSISSFTFNDKRNNGMAYQKATNVWISNQPEVNYSDELDSLTWEFTTSDLKTIGGDVVPVEESIPIQV